MTQSQVFACKFCNTLKNSCYQEHLWTIAEISFWQQGIGYNLCGFPVQKNIKFHEYFPRAILNWKRKIFVNTIMEILENIAINANYTEVVGRDPP